MCSAYIICSAYSISESSHSLHTLPTVLPYLLPHIAHRTYHHLVVFRSDEIEHEVPISHLTVSIPTYLFHTAP